MDTIYALATAQGRAGIAVIRVSGPAAHDAIRHLSGRLPPPRQAVLATLRAADGTPLDQALTLRFDAPASFTGEDVAEFHLHGSRAVVSATSARLSALPGLRPADPGEFTRRALANGRLDLAEVEGLADLIDAETEAQRRQALRLMSGALGERAAAWRATIIRAEALLAAAIDFADEELPDTLLHDVTGLLHTLQTDISAEIAGQKAAERIRDGFEVAIIGPPNAGKSTLLNRLAGRDAALVSEIAGTTRDVIEVRMDLAGLAVTFLDTAGLRCSNDPVEAMGVARARERAAGADLRIYLAAFDTEASDEGAEFHLMGKDDYEGDGERSISGLTGAGIDRLLGRIEASLSAKAAGAGTAVRERHRLALESAWASLDAAQAWLANGSASIDLAAEEMRACRHRLDALVGRIDVEHILDDVFKSFCLGK